MPAISKANTRSRSAVRVKQNCRATEQKSGVTTTTTKSTRGTKSVTAKSKAMFTPKNHWKYVKVLLACVTLASTIALFFAAHAVVQAELNSGGSVFEKSKLDIDGEKSNHYIGTGLTTNSESNYAQSGNYTHGSQNMTNFNTAVSSETSSTTIAPKSVVNHMTFRTRLDTAKLDTAELRTQVNELQFDIATLKTQIFDPLFQAFESGKKMGSKIETVLVSAYDTHILQENSFSSSRGKYFRLRKALQQSVEGASALDVQEAFDSGFQISFPEKLETEVEVSKQRKCSPLSLDMTTDEFTVHFETAKCAPVTRVSVSFAPLGQGTKKVRVVVGEL